MEELTDYSIVSKILNGTSALIAIFGFVGNFLTFGIASKLGEKDQSSGNVFMKSLAIADSVSLLRSGVMTSGFLFVGFNFVNTNANFCSFFLFYAYSGTMIGKETICSDLSERKREEICIRGTFSSHFEI